MSEHVEGEKCEDVGQHLGADRPPSKLRHHDRPRVQDLADFPRGVLQHYRSTNDLEPPTSRSAHCPDEHQTEQDHLADSGPHREVGSREPGGGVNRRHVEHGVPQNGRIPLAILEPKSNEHHRRCTYKRSDIPAPFEIAHPCIPLAGEETVVERKVGARNQHEEHCHRLDRAAERSE